MLQKNQVEDIYNSEFFSLQHFAGTADVRAFLLHYCNDVLNTFLSFKLDSVGFGGRRKHDQKTSNIKPGTEQFFAKYLTNQNLLQLQLSDSDFRRYILLQFLILFQYLQSSVKFKG